MKTTRLGKTGLEVSRICFGCMSFGKQTDERPWVLGLEEARPLYKRAWDAGINFFDTANVYAQGTSEEITGVMLKELAPRQEIVLATKVFGRMRPGPNGQGLSRAAILTEIDNSLRRLGTDYVDLYQIHRFDPFTPVEETMQALNDVVRAGKARYIGASSMWAWQFSKLQHAAEVNGWTKFVSMQNQVSLTYREEEREMLPLCDDQGIAVLPWSPLAGGKLTRPWGTETKRATTDRYNKSMYEKTGDRDVVEAVEALAKARKTSMAQVAMAWVLQKPVVTSPIVGVSKMSHLEDAIAAVDFELTGDDVKALEAPYKSLHVAGF
ncbi:aldo/keto reductase [Rhizobium ruizarguesonis]|uniref:aldo/keto reductase n=1 Tax=Rhizobium ruizarguesonis TaxID=2081791 RepID=UPI00103EA987|nr:aldo/keto reductase [Rhizobium ruizarguesonis]TBY60440.1 aldo/keto reductase [Rhizobium leguminosarum bv. viciae]NEI05458.1 aldo/keto reductase [Rhizobium ruizarguesonis]NEJ01954.1 aldo/keto reductase [Rhizobium ruizarguesonis]NEJ39065.1 aldo/keto reductase [Rhizobium ruizarguesonis]TCA30730.1 aldo/keto reductase [Rhizobium leguminosarum bv. viciae]